MMSSEAVERVFGGRLRNRLNRAIKLGSDGNKYYCGRRQGTDLIPQSDGRCGPTNGPQCPDCKGLSVSKPPSILTVSIS